MLAARPPGFIETLTAGTSLVNKRSFQLHLAPGATCAGHAYIAAGLGVAPVGGQRYPLALVPGKP